MHAGCAYAGEHYPRPTRDGDPATRESSHTVKVLPKEPNLATMEAAIALGEWRIPTDFTTEFQLPGPTSIGKRGSIQAFQATVSINDSPRTNSK